MPISKEHIETAENSFNSLSEGTVKDYVNDFSENQPAIIGYVFAIAETAGISDERLQDIMYYAIIIRQAYKNAYSSLPTVEEDTIEAVEKNLVDGLDNYEDREELTEDEVQEMMNTYFRKNQPEVSDFIIKSIFGELEEETTGNIEEVMMLISVLQVINESFNAQLEGPDSPLKIV